jgi:hypothetical protein
MGLITTVGETSYRQTREQLYDFVTDPKNWPLTYPGSTGVTGIDGSLKFGDVWEETATLEGVDSRYEWRVITANRPSLWTFQSVGRIAQAPDGSGGFEGLITISYAFTDLGDSHTLFRRSLTCETPKGVPIQPEVLLAFEPFFIDEYHAAVAKHLPAPA